jgi:hypothetical protein
MKALIKRWLQYISGKQRIATVRSSTEILCQSVLTGPDNTADRSEDAARLDEAPPEAQQPPNNTAM